MDERNEDYDIYGSFACVYDKFMDNVPYKEWGKYLKSLLEEQGISDGLVLELGCGTGSLTEILADAGYVVASMYYRSSAEAHMPSQIIDVKTSIRFLRAHADEYEIDPDRIGIYGWSYGGFMALNCILKGNDVFRAAIAVAPVTSWRFYDTIYTEIYNGLPQDNPSGYDDNSPIHFADRLKGKLLIAHGTGDDNVHIQTTYEMITKLVEYDKPFELYVYPDRNHGMGPSRHHLMERCIEFVQRNL